MDAERVVAISAIVPAAATLYFFLFWRWFDFWRAHPAGAYTLLVGTLVAFAVASLVLADVILAHAIVMPRGVSVIGWILVVLACGFGIVADRQIGFHVRSFAPFFEQGGRIELVTTGAYGIVRHPIYASGIAYQVGIYLVTGYTAVAIACVVFGLGAAWFTGQEEVRLRSLLKDPSDYDRYRARVPGLLPWPR
jgi:protein-S-isoprenylcysteine O-methyltransferase Ste14